MEQHYKLHSKYIVILTLTLVLFLLAVYGINEKAKRLMQRDIEYQMILFDIENEDKPKTVGTGTQEKSVYMKYIGEFKLTAYCPCEKCCGKWAKNRPVDENGKEIIYTASGAIAQPNKTVGVDTSVIPFGTRLLIGGTEYTAQDTGSKVKGNVIDIYFETHEQAVEFGCKYKDVYILSEE